MHNTDPTSDDIRETTANPSATDAPLTWYFDFISPFAYLQFERMKSADVARRLGNTTIQYRPILFAGLLNHWEHKGPVEIEPKRVFTYRQVVWMARHLDIPFTLPSSHPFNSLPLLRLCIAAGSTFDVVDRLFRYVWVDGNTPADDDAFTALLNEARFAELSHGTGDDSVKVELRGNGDTAVSHGVFGVPTFEKDGHLFWGLDNTGMLLDYLEDPTLFENAEMTRIASLQATAKRI